MFIVHGGHNLNTVEPLWVDTPRSGHTPYRPFSHKRDYGINTLGKYAWLAKYTSGTFLWLAMSLAKTAVAVSTIIRAYFLSLQGPARERYVDKLCLVGLEESDDPYSDTNSSSFTDDLTSWPAIEYEHIFGHLITRSGLCMQEQLLAWKQLDLYNYFQSGYVRTILVWRVDNTLILRALVNPSQRSPDNTHHCWLAVMKDGTVVSVSSLHMHGWVSV